MSYLKEDNNNSIGCLIWMAFGFDGLEKFGPLRPMIVDQTRG